MITDDEFRFQKQMAELIKERRVSADLTAEDNSEKAGVSLSTVYGAENASRSTTIWVLAKFAKVLKCQIDLLIPQV